MELEFLKGSFDPASDTVEVRGGFFGWGSEAPDMVQDPVNPNLYNHTAIQKATVGDELPGYKFYYTGGNWEGGDNKTYKITQEDYDNGFAVVARPFNDASLDNVINEAATITFIVNTAGAISAVDNQPFATVNSVHITGASAPFAWPDGGWPDADITKMIAMYDNGTNGDAVSGDGIFTTEVTFPKYSPLSIEYKYGINYGDAATNGGGNDNENGVGTNHFITLSAFLESATVENTFGSMGTHTLTNVVISNNVPDSIDISVTYQVDMELEFLKGSFDPAADTVEVRGGFFGWGNEAPDMTQDPVNPNLYSHTAVQKATIGDALPGYKFYYTGGNWEGGDNKTYVIKKSDYDNGYAVVNRPFNDASIDAVINQDVTVTFVVNTAGAVSAVDNQPFSVVNTVHLTGATAPLQWPSGGWPSSEIDRMIPMFDDGTHGDATAGDGIFATQVTFPKYTGFAIEYKYGINYGDDATNGGGNDNENGVGANHNITLAAFLVSAKVENDFGVMGQHDITGQVTGIEKIEIVPTQYELAQNYPNPFNPTTMIRFQIPESNSVTLKVYNMLGQEVATLVNESLNAGTYEYNFNAADLSSGVYIYTLSAGKHFSSHKMLLLK
ncbi:MAG: T9SS type A sorting domain-containing protein [Bacteroidetes bacterium]|nr:T9SS type A sorting domain-containing protein [Bacteroidota bacterium]